MIVASFALFLLVFLGIGVASAARARGTDRDYLLAGRRMAPWLVALSAVATGNSGYMFVGQIGFTYVAGLSSIWLMVGWVGGDLLISFLVHRRLREVAGARDVLSFGGIVAGWHGTDFKRLRFMSGIVTVVFLGVYAAAQLKAGSKALHVLLGWDLAVGAIVGCIIVVVYCIAGGIRASIWTDAAQSVVMLVAMAMLLAVTVTAAGGVVSFWEQLDAVSPDYMSWFSADVRERGLLGALLFVLGWTGTGIGVIGQPHIMVRFMTLNRAEHIGRVRLYYYAWATFFFLCAIGVGLAARVSLPDSAAFDPELALPRLAEDHLAPVLVGLILAGLFAATMSTADSQILSCSAAVTRDILPRKGRSHRVTKAATLGVAAAALGIALWGAANVFDLVVIAWSVLAAAFAPVLIVYALGRRVSEGVAVVMLGVGVGVALGWRRLEALAYIQETAPGILAGLLVFAVADRLGFNRSAPRLQP